jgi:hypothetical protein
LTGFSVDLAPVPQGANTILLYYNPNTGVHANIGGLTFNEIFVAASMRLYGVDVTANTSSPNFLSTEFAMQKIVLYGTDNATYNSSGVLLQVDFGGDIPGFIGRDSGSRSQRAVVAASPPRLSWQGLAAPTVAQVQCISVNLGVAFIPPNSATFSRMPAGTLDITVILRRSVIVLGNTPMIRAAETTFGKEGE